MQNRNKTTVCKDQHASYSILLMGQPLSSESLLKPSLEKNGYVVCHYLSSETALFEKINKYQPDLLILNIVQPSQQTLHELAKIHQLAPLTVVVFAQKDCPISMQASIKAGVSSYIVDTIEAHQLSRIIDIAQQRFVKNQAQRKALDETKRALVADKLLEQAKGLLMQQKNISDQEADENIRQMAINNRQPIAIVAHNIIEVSGLLKMKI